MNTLTTKQRAHLRSLAHGLRPVLHIGREGVTQTALSAVEAAFNTRELLKVKVLEGAPQDAGESGAALAAGVGGAHLIQVIGRTVVLYRPHPERPALKLPR
jgi:RNA-binding protein